MAKASAEKRVKVSIYLEEEVHKKLKMNYGESIQGQLSTAARALANRADSLLPAEVPARGYLSSDDLSTEEWSYVDALIQTMRGSDEVWPAIRSLLERKVKRK